MDVLGSEKNEEQGTRQEAILLSSDQLVQRKSVFASSILEWLKMLALDPCNPKASRDSARKLWNQTLKLRLLRMSNTQCPQRKRKLKQFLKDSSFTTASGLASETSNNQNVKKLDSGPFSSVSCLPNSVFTTECSKMQIVQDSYSSSSTLIYEDNFQGKQVHINFNSPDNSIDWSPSNKEISPFSGTDDSRPMSPEILIVQDAPSVDSNDLVQSSDPSTSESKLGKAVRSLITRGEHIERGAVLVGARFQAELPECTGPVKKGNLYDGKGNSENLKWVGIRIWPMEGRSTKTTTEAVGKGRPDSCSCVSPGTADCIKHHVFEAKQLMQSNLGPAFFSWKFDEMGEVVSKSWTLKEQKKFESLVKRNPLLNGTNFWESASKYFPSKCKRSILSYYYNVFLLRRMSLLTRSSLDDVDSDEDRIDAEEEEVENEEDEKLSVIDNCNATYPNRKSVLHNVTI